MNQVVTEPAGGVTRVGVTTRRAGDETIIVVHGTIAADAPVRNLVMKSPDAVAQTGERVRWALDQAGVAWLGRVVNGRAPPGAVVRHVHRSARLADILSSSLTTSNSFDHEMIAAAVASARRGGAPVTVADGATDMEQFLAHRTGARTASIRNASGLGGVNQVSSAQLFDLLRYAARRPRTRRLVRSLAAPGLGTLDDRLIGTAAEGRLRAKTGTDGEAVSLSGYVTRNGKRPRLGFSSLATGPEDRRDLTVGWLDAVAITMARLGAGREEAR